MDGDWQEGRPGDEDLLGICRHDSLLVNGEKRRGISDGR
jgi:hypothetical protein